ncbi:C40 family peptidase [Amycolatopsis aidingensis]|uniref:C40 family peptidase n=1 Tax=Amycolatopsis aidingensis TaxID=2842453 RepID=UPI001C0AE0F4|nr:C40 family peptidase [Amycolatopsis aidingensis]
MNPLLAVTLAGRLRDRARQHPLAWGCLALLALAGPFLGLAVLAGVVVVVIAGSGGSAATVAPRQVPGIPDTMLVAYIQAAQHLPEIRPRCRGMRWSILAGVAQVESRHAAGHTIAPNGDIHPPILGPALDGSGAGGNRTPIRNRDGTYARAAGPFQFLTTTWDTVGQDGNRDGHRNVHNAFDAALGAAAYLCGTGPRDLNDEPQLRVALYSYNHSQAYVTTVLAHIRSYDAIPLRHRGRPIQATGVAKTVIDAAMSQLGVPYAWGGGTRHGPSTGIRDGGVADRHGDYAKIGFDCSGLTLYAYAQAGIDLPRTSRAQFHAGTRVPKEAGIGALRPGDLVFYSPGSIHHVGIYLGNGDMINAPYSGTTVRIDPVDLSEYAGAARLLH